MNILLIGHAVGPGRGSEPGNTWNFAWHLAAEHTVTLLSHPQHRDEVEAELARNARPNLRVEWVLPNGLFDPWDPKRGEKGLHLHYMLWQRAAARKAMELCNADHFDVAHHVSWGTVSAPPLLWGLAVPVIWGPIGGGQTMPSAFKQYFGPSLKKEYLRKLRMAAVPFTPAVRRMARKASITLVTNEETRALVERARARNVRSMLDNGLPPGYCDGESARREPSEELRILWAGRCEPRKALPLGLDALVKTGAKFQLRIAGDGPSRAEWQAYSEKLGLADRVTFLGVVPWGQMRDLFRASDLFLFTSLRDSFGSVVLEAMGHGLPILTLNHNGVRTFVSNDAGIKVSVDSPQKTIDELSSAITTLAGSRERRIAMGAAALEFARTQTWDMRIKTLVQLYRQAIGA